MYYYHSYHTTTSFFSRYWLHAIGLTENLISLPYSDCLLTESSLRHISPITFKTKDELKWVVGSNK